MKIDLKCGDCLELMQDIPDKSIDLILCDLPYGTTRLEWDKPIPFEPLWEQYNRIIKDNGAILLFSAQPFTTDLINSNRKMFRYEIIWEKTLVTGFYNAKKMPLRIHENILVFYKHLPTYNPQKHQLTQEYIEQHLVRIGEKRKNSDYKRKSTGKAWGGVSKEADEIWEYTDTGERYPTDIVKFSNWNGTLFGNKTKTVKHPTQKPLPLLEYLIKTYSNEGDVVLDNCMGSGSTGVACVNLNRNFIGIELDQHFFEVAKERINSAFTDKED
ncbi:MAG: site-specific DNA-methyltransferase [Ruminococcaceae bacterium]|nr:site-specific DNA-methyltransferase [Oscillospiraceae bacterium]